MLFRTVFGRPSCLLNKPYLLSVNIAQCRYFSHLSLNPPKGTRDFYPEDVVVQKQLHGHWKEVARLFGFEQIDSPVVEYEELYDRDVNEKLQSQYYRFQDSSKGHRLNLKADMTPSLCRMVVANHPQATYPLKWFSIPQLWRFEDESPGRRKEFYQWNMDIWGVPGVEAEAELISAAVFAFKKFGLTSKDVVIKINSRKLIADHLTKLGIPLDQLSSVCIAFDKWFSAIPAEQESIPADLKELVNLLQTSGGAVADTDAKKEFDRLLTVLEQYDISDWVTWDPTVVRGLGYYTGIVFEAFDRSGELRAALCGGGRYDDMLQPMFVLHGDLYPTAAAGFGMGDAALEELLRRKQLLPDPADRIKAE